jgi:acetate kinase
MRVLVVNAGSGSLKLRVLDGEELTGSADFTAEQGAFDERVIGEAAASLDRVDAVGHRIVHGGTHFSGPVRIDASVIDTLRTLSELAPLHQPRSLAAVDAVSRALPDVPAVACFDTAFHAHMPDAAATYALPRQWRRRWGLRRFGFHGLSHAYASRRAADLLHVPIDELRAVTCHLGAGASLAAVVGRRSVDTTMGFTPLEGLVMATRSGTVDPGLLLWLEEHAGRSASELRATLEHRSGLLALAGTDDMKLVIERAEDGDAEAQLALDIYLHRLRASIASMAASMRGLDALVFTGGVGENSPVVRDRTASDLAFLGIAIDRGRNSIKGEDLEISSDGAAVHTLVVSAREDLEIAQQVRSVFSK